MTREAFIKKWLGNKDYQYTEQNRDLMRSDLDLVIEAALRQQPVMLRFKLRLNVEEWGMYKKGDEDYFNIKLHDDQNGLTRLPIDKRWDVISCEIVNVA